MSRVSKLHRRHPILLMTIAVMMSACSPMGTVAPAERLAAENWVRQDQAPAPAKTIALWHASDLPDSLLCGEVEAPPALRERHRTLRYVYDPHQKQPYGQVEMHELWVTASPVSQALIDQNRAIFDDTWTRFCAPYAPISRKIAAWMPW